VRFDAYAGSLRTSNLAEAVEVLSWGLKGSAYKGPRVKRYGETVAIDSNGRMAVWLARDDTNDTVYFEGKGESSPDLARSVRVHFPKGHSVSRLDVCEDYDAEGAFGSLQGLVRRFKGPRVKAGYVALPDDPADGSTWAAGARGGVTYVRVYEAGKHPDRAHLARPNLARIELEARPHYAKDKVAAASFAPLDVWGLSAWSHRVGEALTTVEIPRYEHEVRTTSFDQKTLYLARTFDRFWLECEDAGIDWLRTVQQVRQEDAEAEARWKQRVS
jgi:hypothetical protein